MTLENDLIVYKKERKAALKRAKNFLGLIKETEAKIKAQKRG